MSVASWASARPAATAFFAAPTLALEASACALALAFLTTARFVANVRVVTFKDVNVEELEKPDLRLPGDDQF